MNSYILDSLAVVTIEVDAATEAEARQMVYDFQGAWFDAIAPLDTDTNVDRDRIRLRTVSTRCRAALVEALDDDGDDIAVESESYLDPERQTILCPADRDNLTTLVKALRAAAEGDSNDAEIEAGLDLAHDVELLLSHSS